MKFVAFDIETTGTVASVDRIVELGGVIFENGQPVGRFSTLVNPMMPIPVGASRVNGITDDMVVGQPTIEKVLPAFAEFCGDLPMVAHNSPFDSQFLLSDIKFHEAPAPRGTVLDTLPVARKVFPGLLNYKLETLINHLAIEKSHFHRAEADAVYCGQLFVKILEKMGGNVGVENVLALMGRPEFRFPQIIPSPKQLCLLEM